MLEAEITRARRGVTIRATLTLEAGARLALFGPSGAGKSTILACIAGIEQPDAGEIRIDGLRVFPPPLPIHRRPIGYLTQDANLFPHLTVGQNVCFGLQNGNSADGLTEDRWIEELRERLQLARIWQAPPARISGGQARRVALARMLARRPKLVLLDEPFAGLDRSTVRDLIADLLTWNENPGFAMIAVDHQAEQLERLTTKVIALAEGKIVQQGTWDDLRKSPATPDLQDLLRPL